MQFLDYSNCKSSSVIGTRSLIGPGHTVSNWYIGIWRRSNAHNILQRRIWLRYKFWSLYFHDPATTTIDAVFMQGLEHLKLQAYMSYFIYHEPIVRCLTCKSLAGCPNFLAWTQRFIFIFLNFFTFYYIRKYYVKARKGIQGNKHYYYYDLRKYIFNFNFVYYKAKS